MMMLLPAIWEDSADLLRWRNDPLTRANSRNPYEVSPQDHEAWMTACMAAGRPKGWVWIGDVDGTSVGVVRVSTDFEVSITVGREHRGKGYSKGMLAKAIEMMRDHDLMAEIKETNAASQHIFTQAGFERVSDDGTFGWYRRALK